MRATWLLLASASVALTSCLPQQTKMPSTSQQSVLGYGQKARYGQSQALKFADFELRFDGETHVKVKEYPPGFYYENFSVTAHGKSQKIKWSMGTGEIAPAGFSVAGENYLLELRSSDVLGQLKKDELFTWREKDWQQKYDELYSTAR